uniref:PLEKHM2 PH domain-containing protein n=1 Tax=Romanomermis culicivorax TaxID=13658 RepID=A0A915IL46_ROMCU
MEYEYPQQNNRPWYKTGALHCVVSKRRPVNSAFSKSVPKIVDGGSDQTGLLVGSLETSNNYMNVAPPHDFNSTEMICSTPITPGDADFMLKEILKGSRVPKLNSVNILVPKDRDTPSHDSVLDNNCNDSNPTKQNEANENRLSENPFANLDVEKVLHSVATSVDQQSQSFFDVNGQHVLDEESRKKTRSKENVSSSEAENANINNHKIQESSETNLTKPYFSSENNYDNNGNMNERSTNDDSTLILSPSETGELRLDSCEILELTTNVMHDGEQYFKMYRVYLNHHMGNPLLRYLLISNKCLYVLIAKPNSASSTANENGITKKESDKNLPATVYGAYYYVVDHRIPFDKLDYITDEDKICLYALVYWNPNMSKTRFSSLSSSTSTARNGYLYERVYYPNSWLKKSTEWQQCFFILQGKKFYQFEDMSCKVGLKIYNLE